MDDVKYEYGCEVTSTKECPLREEIRAEAIDEFVDAIKVRLLKFVPTDSDDVEMIAKYLKEKNNV